jgi:competence protein ComEC
MVHAPLRTLAALGVLAALSGCGMSLSGITPNVVTAGSSQPVTVSGSGLGDDVLFSLVANGVEVATPVQSASETEATVLVPAAAPVGLYDVVATRGAESASLPEALTITAEALTIVFVDIGQGDCTLVIAPSGEVLLIDGGGLDAGPTVKSAIDTWADGRLDAVIVSHHDADHLAGVVSVLSGDDGQAGTNDDLVPEVLYAPDDDSCETQTCNRFRALAGYSRLSTPLPGDVFTLGEVEVVVVASNGRVGSAAAPGGLDANGRSIAVTVGFAGRRVLVLGDLTGGGLGTADLESPLSELTGPVDVLRTAHHGSATSSTQAAIGRWAPRLSVVSMGTDNAYCHPEQATLDRIAAASVDVVATGFGTVADTDRCDAATSVPANASVGRGTMALTVATDGTMLLDGDEL